MVGPATEKARCWNVEARAKGTNHGPQNVAKLEGYAYPRTLERWPPQAEAGKHSSHQTISVYPPSVAAQRGEHNVVLGCNVTGLPGYGYIKWSYYPTWNPTGLDIYSTRNGINNDPTNFTVYHGTLAGDTQSLGLVIKTVKPELAARYKCDFGPRNSQEKSINVVVLGPMVSVYPPSVGAQRGEQNIRLSCNVTGLSPNNYIEWIYYPTWLPTGFTIYSTFNGINNDPNNFTVLPMTTVGDTQSLDLVINTAKPELGTQYRCNLSPTAGFGQTSNVVVLEKIYCSNGVVEYHEDKEANILCRVIYHDSSQKYAPRITWKRDGQEIPGVVHTSYSNISKTATLTKNMTSADNDRSFVCAVDFLDSNPDYTDNCSTTVFVRYAIGEISFYPPSSAEAPAEVAVGAHIICLVHGRSYATIEWYGKYWNMLSGWNQLTVTKDMFSWKQPITLHCRARNQKNYGGDTIAAVEASYTFNVVDAEPIVPSGGTTAATTTTTNDAVGEISFYPPSSAEAPAEIAVGAYIICQVHGKSYSKIDWYDKHWNWVSGWNQVTVRKEMRFWKQPITLHCRATNQKNYYGGDAIAAVEASYTFNVSGAVEPWVIAMAVIVPIMILVAIAIAVFYRIRHRKMKEKYRAIATKDGSTSALLVNY